MAAVASVSQNPRFRLSLTDTLRIVGPYLQRNFVSQIKGIWFIVTYLLLFQLLVLTLPIVYAAMIAAGILIVAVGLMFFMEGLRLGLMPLGEVIGSVLPRNSKMPLILTFAFLLGVGATFAEPAIAVLKAAGATVSPTAAPLLFSLLNDFSGQLVAAVGVGVGAAVLLGVLRFFYGWPLKYLAIPAVSVLLLLSLGFAQVQVLNDVLGLAWDCGAVTTGPVTVPLVLALGIGVCRVVASGSGGGGHTGFGIVTLASLFPILAVLLLSLAHYAAADYYGAENYRGPAVSEVAAVDTAAAEDQALSAEAATPKPVAASVSAVISQAEFERYLDSGELPDGYAVNFNGGKTQLIDGRIVVQAPDVIIAKTLPEEFRLFAETSWDNSQQLGAAFGSAMFDALRAIVPLCVFLFFVLRIVLRQPAERDSVVGVGVAFALVGMALFGLGISLGLTPLGGQLGSNVPLTFADIVPLGADSMRAALFEGEHAGKLVAVVFAFFLGYGATLAEPALNALGDTVERVTVGAFRKKLLMQSVAIGVGLGIGAGVIKLAYGIPLIWMLLPAYLLVLVLTWFAPNIFVDFSWDSAGVTTGPITVPLVLAMGLGLGANLPGISDGFGILAMASVGPILTVLTVGLYTTNRDRDRVEAEQMHAAVDDGLPVAQAS